MLLGIDIGTTKIAAVIITPDGDVLAAASRPHEAARRIAPAGHAEQAAVTLYTVAQAVVRSLPPALRWGVDAIGSTGQMHGVMLCDARGDPLTPLITWQDQRCNHDDDFLLRLGEATGYALASGYGCATLAWLQAQGELPAAAVSACTIHDWLTMRWCGRARPVTDPTDAASWGCFSRCDSAWDAAAIRATGVRLEIFPAVQPCGSLAGTLTAEVAEDLGLRTGIPLAVAVGDNQASLRATLHAPAHELALTLGTGGQLSAVVESAATATLSSTAEISPSASRIEWRPYLHDDTVLAVGASLTGGAAWAWLAESAQRLLREMGATLPPLDEIYPRLNQLGTAANASAAPLTMQPHLFGERYDAALRACILGIDRDNFTLGNIARALARGIITNLHAMLPPEILTGRTRIVGSGNALRRNPLLREMTETVFGLPLQMTSGAEEAAVGAALNAARLIA